MEYAIYGINHELYHHGVKGQKWYVRRYQNEDGTLTELGRKRQLKDTASDRKAVITKGTTLYRVSDKNKSDLSTDKIYITADKTTSDHYVTMLGGSKIYKTGKAYLHEYANRTDLKMPDKKTMEKVELSLLKDKDVRRELVDSLMNKGYSREDATKNVRAYSAGVAAMEDSKRILGSIGFGVMAGGKLTAFNPLGIAVGAGLGTAGGVALAVKDKDNNSERKRALNVARMSYGDINNKVINERLKDELTKRGYNAMKDYNDRRAFGDNGKQAIIVFNSDKNLTSRKISEIKSTDYANAYARKYLKDHPKSQLDFNDLVKDGEDVYKRLYEDGVIVRKTAVRNKKILESDRLKN